jgi:CheY-like chemotaxis protein
MKKKILIVDDEPQIREIISMTLENEGYETYTAENGIIALENFNKLKFDLVIIDLIMPEKEGIETIVEIKKIKDIPIIAISGGGSFSPVQYLEIAKKLGADAKLTKPISSKKLIETVKLFI